jgi:hypothetical protein
MPQLIQIRGPAMVASTPLFRHESVALQTSLAFAAFVKEKALAKRDCLTLALLHCLITPLTNLPRHAHHQNYDHHAWARSPPRAIPSMRRLVQTEQIHTMH